MVQVVVSRYGRIGDGEVSRIVDIMGECYARLEPHDVLIVDLCLFEGPSHAWAFLAGERRDVGVASSPLEEPFFAWHDAWRGTPRIALCLGRMRGLPEPVGVGGIRHEVGHTVLHGDPGCYIIPIPAFLQELAGRYHLPPNYVADLLYLISIAVKDYEVTRLLYGRGYVEDQVAYAKFMARSSEEELLSWRLSRGRPQLEVLCLAGHLKALGCAAPLLRDERLGGEVREALVEGLSHLPGSLTAGLMDLAEKGFPSLKSDTLENIYAITDRCRSIFETIFNGAA